jgi:hypothetical protein
MGDNERFIPKLMLYISKKPGNGELEACRIVAESGQDFIVCPIDPIETEVSVPRLLAGTSQYKGTASIRGFFRQLMLTQDLKTESAKT